MAMSRTRMRVGQGFDVHPLVEGRPLILGGVTIPHHKGLQGHSDADALLHAITDALLGAAGLGDIGRHFPDNDPAFEGADSRVLLRHAYQKIHAAGWQLVNLDATIHAQAPKISPYVNDMIGNLSNDLRVTADVINIKGKTNESLGFLGREEGIAVTTVVLIEPVGG